MTTTKIKPTAAAVKRMGNGAMGWASFKHRLYDMGVLASPTDSVPVEWIAAYYRAMGRHQEARAMLAKFAKTSN